MNKPGFATHLWRIRAAGTATVTMLAFLLASAASAPTHADGDSQTHPTATFMRNLMQLKRAYIENNRDVLHKYTLADNPQLALYARGLASSSVFRFADASTWFKRCAALKLADDASLILRGGCLHELARTYAYRAMPREHALANRATYAFMTAHKHSFMRVFGRKLVDAYIAHPPDSSAHPEKWLPTKYVVDRDWAVIPLHRGSAEATIAGKRFSVRLDTGSTGIFFTRAEALRAGILTKANFTGLRTELSGYGPHMPVAIYNVPSLQIGPLVILNSKVMVPARSHNREQWHFKHGSIGIDIMRKLGNLVVTDRAIKHVPAQHDYQCTPLHLVTGDPAVDAWAVSFRLQTSFGNPELLFDSGWVSDYSSLALFYPYAVTRLKTLHPVTEYRIKDNNTGNKYVAPIFHFTFAGNPTSYTGSAQPASVKRDSPVLDGILGQDTLRNTHMSVYLDFDHAKACVRWQ